MYLYHQLTAADLLAAQDVLNETTAVVKIVSDFRNRLICPTLFSFFFARNDFRIAHIKKRNSKSVLVYRTAA